MKDMRTLNPSNYTNHLLCSKIKILLHQVDQIFERVPMGVIEFSSTFGPAVMITGHELSNDSNTPVVLVVDQGNHELTGFVYDQFHYPVDGANVVLSWINSQSGTRSVVDRRTTTSPSGRFSMQGIGSGEHELLITAGDGSSFHRTVDINYGSTGLTIFMQPTQLIF